MGQLQLPNVTRTYFPDEWKSLSEKLELTMRLVTCQTCQAKNENIGFKEDIGIFFNPYILQHPVLVYLQSIEQLVKQFCT